MQHTRLHIIQFLGIFMLICSYFLGDQPDSWSVMHFDPNPACQSVFSKASKNITSAYAQEASVSSQGSTSRKTETPTHILFEVILPQKGGYVFHQLNSIFYSSVLLQNYNYLFFEEINPPPPKAC